MYFKITACKIVGGITGRACFNDIHAVVGECFNIAVNTFSFRFNTVIAEFFNYLCNSKGMLFVGLAAENIRKNHKLQFLITAARHN